VVFVGAAYVVDDKPAIPLRRTELAKGDVFCDRVVPAISRVRGERDEQGRPEIGRAVRGDIVDRLDIQVDGAVDLGNPRPTVFFGRPIDQREKSGRSNGSSEAIATLLRSSSRPR
jgi:hypothetical protein